MPSFKSLQNSDFVISSDSVASVLWSTGNPILTTFHTQSTPFNDFYLEVYQEDTSEPEAEIQFNISYGNYHGSGSELYNSAVSIFSPTKTIYDRYRNLIYGDNQDTDKISFNNVEADDFYSINFERARYKEKLFLGSFNLKLSGSNDTLISLTDNSKDTNIVEYCNVGRVYEIVSGSNGEPHTVKHPKGYHVDLDEPYGLLYPDIGLAILNAKVLDENDDSIHLDTDRTANSPVENPRKLYEDIKRGKYFQANSEETISSNYIFVRAQNFEFNYSENPSFIAGSTGEVLHPSFIEKPKTYITTVGLYNDNNELVAVAKLSRPLEKDFVKETLIRCKLDF